ncbi:MAG: glucose-1-phosphate adenylyltransferase subunit GlgD [Oscillospiraceae bacterium]|nr:glucose-1-phosphate adenylyltransferase subunit GlgD [Oscillospiraceae bacterium]
MNDMHGLIFAYAGGPHIKELTEHRTVSSLPFGGRYRAIDFMLSNMVNADIVNVGVIMRENYQSLLDHLGSGKDWDLARKRGGLKLLPPFGYNVTRVQHEGGAFLGNMAALAGVNSYLSRIREKYVVMADGDLVANLPLEDALRVHIDSGADITLICSPRTVGSPEYAVNVALGEKNRVSDISIGRKEPEMFESLNVSILSSSLLDSLVGYCSAHNAYDFERDVLQRMRDLDVVAYLFDGYVARLHSTSMFFRCNMDLLRAEVRESIFRKERPIKTKGRDQAPTYYGPGASVRNCVVADGCYIEGEAENSVIFRGVRISEGVRVHNSILMQNTKVSQGAVLGYAITDKEVVINRGRMLLGHETYPIAIAKGSVV